MSSKQSTKKRPCANLNTDDSVNKVKIPKFYSSSTTSNAFTKITGSEVPVYEKVEKKELTECANNDAEEAAADDTTTNGALAFSSTGCSRLDLFFNGLVRGASQNKINELVNLSWHENAEHSVQLLMHARDCRGGKGEKLVVYHGLLWLRQHKPLTYLLNLAHFLQLGYFKDLLILSEMAMTAKLPSLCGDDDPRSEYIELQLFAEYLKQDMLKLHDFKTKAANGQAGETTCSLSLAGKWAPSEGKHYNKLAKRLARLLYKTDSNRRYRKMLVALRNHINIVETLMCQQQYSWIQYEYIPSKAHRLLRKAFMKHEPHRYQRYLGALQTGAAKINVKGTHPHELVSGYILRNESRDLTLEAQWDTMLNGLKKKGCFSNAVALVDVSGSMTCGSAGCSPLAVAIALGLIISELTTGPYHNRLISFSSTPKWHMVRGQTLHDKIDGIKRMDWGMTTNLSAAFEMILDLATKNNVPASEMPTTLFIFSDMQFDAAVGTSNQQRTTFQQAKRRYDKAGYQMPNVVFWNLNGKNKGGIPITKDENGACLMSGYSSDLIETFFDLKDFNPMDVMMNAIKDYPVLVCDGER